MLARPLSHCGLFSKGASIVFFVFLDFGFSAKSDCPVFFVSSESMLLMYIFKKYINVIKTCFKCARQSPIVKCYDENFADFISQNECCGGCDFKLL